MDDRILTFIKSLKKQLDGIPGEEVGNAVSYYEEYLNDASEAGKNIDEMLLQLGTPEKIASEIKAEASITRAKRSPGLKSFVNVMKYAFTGISTPIAFLCTVIFVIISYSLVIIFFTGAAGVFAGAVGSMFIAIYEATSIPTQYPLEILGTIGLGLLCSGICMLVSLGLYRLCRLLIIASAKIIQRFQKKPSVQAPEMGNQAIAKAKKSKRPIMIFTIISVLGLSLFFASGLPIKYFTIFNSMKPQNLTIETKEFSADKINNISIITAHSRIKLEPGTSDKIMIRYEKPDWLGYEIGVSGSMLSFYESSNGRLSLFKLITLHESRTEVIVSLPAGYSPEIATLESTGGYIMVKDIIGNINAKTYTGNISLDNSNAANGSYNIKATTGTGYLEVNGAPSGNKSEKGIEYYYSSGAGKTINLQTSRGNVTIFEK